MKTIKGILYMLAVWFVVFACLEFFSDGYIFVNELAEKHIIPIPVRLTNQEPEEEEESAWVEGEYLRGEMIPHQNLNIGNTVYSVDKTGFRTCPGCWQPEYKRTIVCIGDSVTFGWAASSDSATYPSQLFQMLTDDQVNVINAGFPRWNSMDLFDLYVTKIVPIKPTHVVLLVGWNDLGYEMTHQSPSPDAPESRSQKILDSVTETFSLGNVLKKIADRFPKKPLNVTETEMETIQKAEFRNGKINWAAFDAYENILRSFVVLCKANGTRPVLVTLSHFLKDRLSWQEKYKMLDHLQDWGDLGYRDWRQMIMESNKRIRKVAKEERVDLAECEKCIPSEDFTDIAHLNDQGNKRLARCIADTLIPLLDQR